MLIVGKFPILARFIHTILLCFISYFCAMFLCFSVLKSPIPADLICFNYSPL